LVTSWTSLREQCNCETCDTFGATDGSEALGPATLHRHWSTNSSREILLHGGAMGCNLGSLTYDIDVDILDSPTITRNQRGHFSQQLQRVGTLPPRVGVRKMHSDVTQTRRTKQRVGHCVRYGVGIAVAKQSTFARNRHTTKHQWSVVIGKSVYVEPLTDA